MSAKDYGVGFIFKLGAIKDMIKYLLFISFFNFTVLSFTQGNLRVTFENNKTGLLKDNISLDTIKVIITSTYGDSKIDYTFTSENKNCQLSPGFYNLSFVQDHSIVINICEVLIKDSEYTFIQILTEPVVKLSWFEKRKRKKTYDKYKKSKCS